MGTDNAREIAKLLMDAADKAEAAGIDAARIPECLSGGHADGTLLTCEPAASLPMTQRYFLF